MTALRHSILVHGLGFTAAIGALLAFIAILLLSMFGLGVAVLLNSPASPLMALISAGCGLVLIIIPLQAIFAGGTPPH